MSNLQTQLRTLLARTPSGAKLFADLLNRSHEGFFGSKLNEEKIKKYAGKIVGIEDRHAYSALGNQAPQERLTALYDQLAELCNRTHDYASDCRYLDLYYPIFEVKIVDEGCEPEYVRIGIWTTVEFDEEEKYIRISQTIKSQDTRFDDFSEGMLAPNPLNYESHMLMKLGRQMDEIAYNPCYMREDVIERLSGEAPEELSELATNWKKAIAEESLYSQKHLMALVVRAVQQMEYDRIVNVIGETPRADFTRYQSTMALFDGVVDFNQL